MIAACRARPAGAGRSSFRSTRLPSRAAALAIAAAVAAPLAADAAGRLPPRQVGASPANLADVVGRDLGYFGLGFLGHLAIWTGDSVIEVLDENPVVQQNGLADFRSRERFWGTVYYPGLAAMNNGWTACRRAPDCGGLELLPGAAFAVVRRASHAKTIGAVYTLSTAYRPFAYGGCRPEGCFAAQRGVYRSDAFVRDMFMSTADAWVAANPGRPRPIELPPVSVPRDLYFFLAERY